MLSVKQVPYTGTLGSTKTKHRSKAPSIEALKRALARLGYMEWKGVDFTPAWPAGGALDKAFREWERNRGMPGDGIYGEQEWKEMRGVKIKKGPKKGQYALDTFARKLIQEDWKELHVPDEEDVRAAIVKFCLLAEKNEPRWHYRMVRPLDVTVDPSGSYIVSDCSMFVIQAYNYAGRMTGVKVPDPSKMNYTGYGNTELHENDHPKVSSPFKVGDLAHYPGHVTICRRPGNAQTAIFTSHGQEAGPIPTQIYYRRDFQYVVRPPLKGG